MAMPARVAAQIERDVTKRIVQAMFDAGRPYRGVIYPGMMVTDDGPRVVEAFVLDFTGDLYGRHVRIEFVKRLRAQERFDDVDALVAQMRRDVEAARDALAQAAATAAGA